MVRLAIADAPGIVCLQEVPVWALSRLGRWSGMTSIGDVAKLPSFGPVPWPAEFGRVVTDLNHALFRSAFTGQGNAILAGSGLTVVDHRRVVLNPFRFRRGQARRFGLGRAARLAWAVERRVCQAVRLRRDDGRTLVVGNLHATANSLDKRLADAELLRAATFVDGMASPQEPVLLCGDFNLSVRRSRTLAELMTDEWGFSGASPIGIDHVLVRGLPAGAPNVWPADRRLRDGRLLSDHTPVEREVE